MGKVILLGLCVLLLVATLGLANADYIENLKKLDIPETDLWDPVLSPDGAKIAYVAYDEARSQQIFVMNADGTGKRKITNDELKKWGLAWGMDRIAYISFGKDGLEKIFVINPDGTDSRQLILDNTRQGNSGDDKPPVWAAPSWSPDGKFIAYTSLDEKANPKMYMVRADGTGKKQVFLNDPFRQWSPSISPDGKNIVYVSYNDRLKEELFIVDINGTSRRQLTFDEIKKNYPFWGPNGIITYVSYENVTSSGEKIFAINQDGTNRRVFVDADYKQQSPTFSRNGERFSYAAMDSLGTVKIAVGGKITGVERPTAEKVTPAQTQTAIPIPEVIAEGIEGVLWTMLKVLGIIVVLLLALLLIADILSKK